MSPGAKAPGKSAVGQTKTRTVRRARPAAALTEPAEGKRRRKSASSPDAPATPKRRAAAKPRDQADSSTLMPHEVLLAVARGEVIADHVPTFEERVEAAKAAAPYFAPKPPGAKPAAGSPKAGIGPAVGGHEEALAALDLIIVDAPDAPDDAGGEQA